jgi:hypothetical protein
MQQKDIAFLPHFNGKVQEIRSMGYDFIGAVLELTDNSARRNCKSSRIDVVLHADDKLLGRVSVIDDGRGMTFDGLKEAIVFNLLKARDDGDIGKFHVGLKYASIVIGDFITILSKTGDGCCSGVHLDISQMKEMDTFTPTDMRADVDDAWALNHIHPSDWARFSALSSGTIVSIKHLTPMCKTPMDKVKDELLKVLPFAYSMLYGGCVMRLLLGNASEPLKVITPYDMFYKEARECLDEDAYETELRLYRDLNGVRVFEVNRSKRLVKIGVETNGKASSPVYYEYTPYVVGRRGRQNNMTQVAALPDESRLIDAIHLRLVQVNKKTYDAEKELFPAGSKLIIDRKGVFFIREIRQVCSAHQLGKKMCDRSVMSQERQRCLVTFKGDVDDLVGSKYNKQMDGLLALPCAALNDAIHAIYKQVTNPWTRLHPGKQKDAALSDDEEEEQEQEQEQEQEPDANQSVIDLMRSKEKKQKQSSQVNRHRYSDDEEEEQEQDLAVQEQEQEQEQEQDEEQDLEQEQDQDQDQEQEQDLVVQEQKQDLVVQEQKQDLAVQEQEQDQSGQSEQSEQFAQTVKYSERLYQGDVMLIKNGDVVHTFKAIAAAPYMITWLTQMRMSDLAQYEKYVGLLTADC